MKKNQITYKLVVFIIIVLTALFLLPIFIGGWANTNIKDLFESESNGFTPSLLRTILFALTSASINVVIGFLLALLLSKISLYSKLGNQLSFFIFPIILGNVAVVFIFKLLLFDTTFFNRLVAGGALSQNAFLIFLQFWQFGFLFAYLFWLNIQNTPRRIVDYSDAAGLSGFEKIRDILLPQSKNLFILLLFIGFAFSFYEDVKSQFIFKASQGTNTEFINHWLNRSYQTDLLINPGYANQVAFKAGLVIFFVAIAGFGLMGGVALAIFKLVSKLKSRESSVKKSVQSGGNNYGSSVLLILCLLIILTPALAALLKAKYDFSESISSLGFPFLITCIAALASTVIAIILGIASRLAFRKWLSSFNSKSLFYFIIIFLLQVIPPLCIVICGFKWLSWIGYSSNFLIYIVWIIGHCILTLPILGSFIISTHFSVKENELEYLSAQKISKMDIVKFSFLQRFKTEYIFTVLFAFTFIWNDASLNMILSDRIPSFATNLQMLYIGRAADYSKATVFLLVAIFLSLASTYIWKAVLIKGLKFKES